MQKMRHYIRILNKRFHYTSKYGLLILYLLLCLSYILLSCGKPKESNRFKFRKSV